MRALTGQSLGCDVLSQTADKKQQSVRRFDALQTICDCCSDGVHNCPKGRCGRLTAKQLQCFKIDVTWIGQIRGIWPVLLMGGHSVIPSTIPRKTTFNISIRSRFIMLISTLVFILSSWCHSHYTKGTVCCPPSSRKAILNEKAKRSTGQLAAALCFSLF